jgi:hypothetical protein
LNLALLIMSVGYLFKVSAAPAVWCRKSLVWVKLSNSGDSLKLLIPSCSRKAISGWINHSCMVISQKISEKKMGYRGSKSAYAVKEQRVDGSWYGVNILYLRCTLTGFERNYQVKILSKQINKSIRLYSSNATQQYEFPFIILFSSNGLSLVISNSSDSLYWLRLNNQNYEK